MVKELKELDDKYLEMQRACDKEIKEIQRKYREQQKPLLEKRTEVLSKPGENQDDASTGTPAQKGFWVTAMQNHPALEDIIQKWDIPVLEYLKNITSSPVDENEPEKGFKIALHFAKNPYFEAEVLEKQFSIEEESPYTQEYRVTEIKATEILWNEGKDVTVEKKAKKVKGGGAKKAKQKKEKEEPRESFFRDFFRSLKAGEPVPDDVNLELSDDEEDDDEIMEALLERDHEIGEIMMEQLIPFAVRWFTGEAAPEMDEDDEDSEEEDSEDDDESEDVPAPKKKGGKPPAGKPGKDGKEESPECKQQ